MARNRRTIPVRRLGWIAVAVGLVASIQWGYDTWGQVGDNLGLLIEWLTPFLLVGFMWLLATGGAFIVLFVVCLFGLAVWDQIGRMLKSKPPQ